MPKMVSEKCRLCAKLSAAEAIAKHGPSGTGCWEGDKCHKRRTYYRNRDRYNASKRVQYRNHGTRIGQETTGQTAVINVAIPAVPAAVLHLYRERVDDPLHAIGAELWLGQNQVAEIEPMHAMGMMPAEVKALLKEVLVAFTRQAGTPVFQFEVQTERSPQTCPIRPCPLHE